jgi:enoyl-CoA hydratase/carnithine racemase
MTELVKYETRAGIATITLDSPANRNALSAELISGMAGGLAEARQDAAVRGVVLTGTGTTFCAGADLKNPPGEGRSISLPELMTEMWAYPKPLIIRLNGHVRAGGTGLVAAADIVVAPESATFAFTEVRIGVAPAMVAVVCARRMTPRALYRYALTGETFGAAAAAECGLVTIAVPDDELDTALAGVLDGVRRSESNALRATKELLVDLPALGLAEGFAHAEPISMRLFSSPEAKEGITAFREKRPPSWAVVDES